MNSLLVLFIHNRPNILKACIQSALQNAHLKFDEVLFINDNSDLPTTQFVVNEVFRLKKAGVNINLLHFNTNQGYGGASEVAFAYSKLRNPKYYFHIESDYIFRVGWAKEAVAVLEASPQTLAISAYSHPDFYDIERKLNKDYPEAIIREYGSDPCPRELLFKPFELATEIGPIKVQGTSNSAGCCIVNWHNFMALSDKFPKFEEDVLGRTVMKGGNRKTYSDGAFSHGSCWFWYNHYKALGSMDFSQTFAWLDICDFSLSNHICGGPDSINGYIANEGETFVGSPKWKNEYLTQNPRGK